MINTFVHLMIQKIKKIFRLSNTAQKIFWVARIFDATLPNFTNGRAIAPPVPLSSTPMEIMQTKNISLEKILGPPGRAFHSTSPAHSQREGDCHK